MRLSNILGACVCSVYEGKHLGYILDATFSEKYKKVSGFVVVNDDDDYEYFLGAKQIIGQDDDVLFVKNETSISTKNYEEPLTLVNKAAYFLDGKFIGKVRDIEIDENFETKQIVFDNITLSIDKLFNVGIDFCFFCEEDKKPKLCRFAPTKQPQISNMSVRIMEISNPQNDKIKIPQKIHAYDSIEAIGKIATQTIFGKNNEIIVKKGEIVTLDCIKKAKTHNVYLSF